MSCELLPNTTLHPNLRDDEPSPAFAVRTIAAVQRHVGLVIAGTAGLIVAAVAGVVATGQ